MAPRYQQERQKAHALTGSTFGIYSRSRSGLQTKQKLFDSLNFNDTVLITVMFVPVLQPNTAFYLSKQ